MKRILAIIGAVVLMASIAGGVYFAEDRYASANDLRLTKQQVRENKLKNDIRWYQDQMQYIMSRCGKRNPQELPEHAFQYYESYRIKKEQLDKELSTVMSK